MTDFCGIPLTSLRENSITELDLQWKFFGELGAVVLSKLLPSAVALTSLKCAAATQSLLLLCQRPLTLPPSWQLGLHPKPPPHHQAVQRAQGQRRDLAQVRHRPRVFAFLLPPVDTPQLPPLLTCSQHLVQRPWPQRRSRSRRGPQGQHHAAIAQVGRMALKPAPECSPLCQRPLAILVPFWQLGQERALWPRSSSHHRGYHHLWYRVSPSCRGYHQAVRETQGQRRDLAGVRRPPQ